MTSASPRRRHSLFGLLKSQIPNPKSKIARPRRPRFEPLENRELLALVSYWSADNTAVDSVSGNDGTLQNGATFADGQVNQAFRFDGIDDRVLVADSPSLELTHSLSIEAWLRVDGFSPTKPSMIVFRGDSRPGLDPYVLSIQTDGTLLFRIKSDAGPSAQLWADIPKGQLVHVAATLDDATGEVSLFENGVLMAHLNTPVRPFGALDPTQQPGLGIGNGNSTYNVPFHGLIDELKIYDYALTSDEVLANFNATKGDLETTIAISDATATEGPDHARLIDVPISSTSSPVSEPRSIVQGPNGDFFVTSSMNDTVLRYDAATFQYKSTFVPAGSGGLAFPVDLVFANGDLFVSSANSGAVLRYNGQTGTYLGEFAPAGAQGMERPTDLLVREGKLYISDWSGSVFRYDLFTGLFVDKFVVGLNDPVGMAFAPDGSFLVGEFAPGGNNAIFRYDATGALLGEFVPEGSGGMSRPAGMKYGPDGNLYVVDMDNDRVLRFNGATGAFMDAFVSAGQAGMDGPTRLMFLGNQLFVTSAFTNQIIRFGAPWELFTVTLSSPSAMAVTVDYHSDYDGASGTISFAPGQTSQTIFVPTIDNTDTEPNETFNVVLSAPSGGVIVDGTGVGTIIDDDTKFFVVDDGSANRTFEYNASGYALENYMVATANSAPRGAASTAAGDKVWVVDANRNVYVYNPAGGLLGSWSVSGFNNSAQFAGIATNGSDIWIVDAKSDKVYRFAGAATRLSGSQGAASSFGLNSGNKDASDLVTDSTSIWVLNNTSSTDKVFKYTVSGTLQGSWTISGGGGNPTGLTIDPSNVSNIWIVDSATDTVYQFGDQFVNAASRTSGSLSPSASFALASGNTNPQGIADPPTSPVGDALSGVPSPSAATAGSSSSATDSALLSIVGELDGLLSGGKKRK